MSENEAELDDPLTRALDLELEQKRAEWQRCRAKLRSLRTISFLFLFVIVVSALIAGFVVLTRVNAARQGGDTRSTTASR